MSLFPKKHKECKSQSSFTRFSWYSPSFTLVAGDADTLVSDTSGASKRTA